MCSFELVTVYYFSRFATTEMMAQYGLLLEDYLSNEVYVNNCIFTVMHHVGGELDSLITLFQPKLLNTFTDIWKKEYKICDVRFFVFFHRNDVNASPQFACTEYSNKYLLKTETS